MSSEGAGTPTCPRKLSWGRPSGSRRTSAATSRPGTSVCPQQLQSEQVEQHNWLLLDQGSTAYPAAGNQAAIGWERQLEEAPGDWQHAGSLSARLLDQAALPSSRKTADASPHADTEAQVRRAVLRSILAAILQEDDGPQLDNYQLTVQGVAAVTHHKTAEAASRAREEATASAAVAARQQVLAAQQEAELKAHKQVAEANAKAAAAAAAHSEELSSLKAQVAALQADQRQLYGKAAQQSRNARQAVAVADEQKEQLEQLRQQVQQTCKKLEVKEAALARNKAAHSQEVAALKLALQEATADAAAAAAEHERQLHELQVQHASEQAAHELRLQTEAQLNLQAVQSEHTCQLHEARQQLAQCALNAVSELKVQLDILQHHQHQQTEAVRLSLLEAVQDGANNVEQVKLQLQSLHEECEDVHMLARQVLLLAAHQQQDMHQLQCQVDKVAPQGLMALQTAVETARREHAVALQQLQDASMQLAALQPQLLQLQQDKQHLQEQLVAADAARAAFQQSLLNLQQEAQEQASQHTSTAEQLQRQLAEQQQLLSAALANGQKLAEAKAAAEAAGAASQTEFTQRHEEQQQQLTQAVACHKQHLKGIQERLQWIYTAYFGHLADAESNQKTQSSAPVADATAAIAVLQQLCYLPTCAIGNSGSADELMSKYESYQQHKTDTAQHAQQQQLNCISNSETKRDALVTSVMCCEEDDAAQYVKQLLLQVEAGLLQHMLSLREATQIITEQQMQQHSHEVPATQNKRPATATSRCTDSSSVSSSVCSKRSSDLTGQLLQALAKDKKQLAQELKRLQMQQVQQQRCSRSIAGFQQAYSAVTAAVGFAGMSSTALQPQQCPTEDVDEVLLLLSACQLEPNTKLTRPLSGARRISTNQGSPVEHQAATSTAKYSRVNSTSDAANPIHRGGIGSLSIRTNAERTSFTSR